MLLPMIIPGMEVIMSITGIYKSFAMENFFSKKYTNIINGNTKIA